MSSCSLLFSNISMMLQSTALTFDAWLTVHIFTILSLTWLWCAAAALQPWLWLSVWGEQPGRKWSTLQRGSNTVTRHQTPNHGNENKLKQTERISKERIITRALLVHLLAVFSQRFVKKYWCIIFAHLFSSGWEIHQIALWDSALRVWKE